MTGTAQDRSSVRVGKTSDLFEQLQDAQKLVAGQPTAEAPVVVLQDVVDRLVANLPGESVAQERSRPATAAMVAEAREKLLAGSHEDAEILLRQRLRDAPRDVEAMNLIADIAARCGLTDNAVNILRRATEFEPDNAESWDHLGRLLHTANRFPEALVALDRSLQIRPSNEAVLSYKAAMITQWRDLPRAVEAFKQLTAAFPASSRAWMNFAFVLKTLGRVGEAIAAYRTAVAIKPSNGTAWWGMANMKTTKFHPRDLATMAIELAREVMSEIERIDMRFAYSWALGQSGDHHSAFTQLSLGSAERKALHSYDSTEVRRDVDASVGYFSARLFETFDGLGDKADDPIFILGMPRSGSTLLEQILASHSLIEGTEELWSIQRIAQDLESKSANQDYRAGISRIHDTGFAKLGQRYLEETARYRTDGRRYFIDKMPGNWPYVGLIHLILPNAKIIDIRRNPMDCCYANLTQHYQWGMNFSYDQVDVAKYYADYVRLMRHFDTVIPGRIHRLIYEDMIDDLEGSIRAVFAYLGLPFEENCLRYFETERAVHTPSAQQVRQPVNRAGLGRWSPHAAALQPMANTLAELRETYRN